MKEFLSWLSNFDALKAIFLAIVAVLGSWYDLKGTVAVNRTVAEAEILRLKENLAAYQNQQSIVDSYQTSTLVELKKDINDGFKDIKDELRAGRRAIK